jgi:hypothetical protein
MASIVDIIIRANDLASDDIKRVERKLDDLEHSAKRTVKVTSLLGVAMATSSSAIASTIPLLGGLLSSFGAASLGVAGFAAVAVPSISRVIEKSEDMSEALKNATKEEANALRTLQQFKKWWSGFTKQFEPEVFNLMANGLKFFQNTMEALKPAIKTTGEVLNQFMERANKAFQTDQIKSFFEYVNNTVKSGLTAVLKILGNTLLGLMELMKNFSPIADQMSQKLVKMTEGFRKWAENLKNNKGFQEFMDYAMQSMPIVSDLFSNLSVTFGKLLTALIPLGNTVLKLVNSFLEWFNTSQSVKNILDSLKTAGQYLQQNMEQTRIVATTLVGAFLAFKGIQFVTGVIVSIVKAFRTLKTVISVARTVLILLNSTILASPWFWLIAAIGAAILIGVKLYKNWDTIKAKAKTLWATIKSAWEGIKSTIKQKINEIIQSVKSWMNQKVTAIRNGMNNAKNAVASGMRNIISTIKSWFSTMISSGRGLMQSFARGIKSGLSAALSAVRNGMAQIRSYLPFSPAKRGPLSDLDKSGESFFPTWMRGVEKGVPYAMRAMDSAMNSLSGNDNTFTFSNGKNVVIHRVEFGNMNGTINMIGPGGVSSIGTGGNLEEKIREVIDNYFREIRVITRTN